MSRAKKPNPQHGPVQPYKPPKLSDSLIFDIQCLLGTDVDMRKVTINIEHRLGVYQADVISLDKAPTLASIKAELEPVLRLVYQLYDALETLSPSSLDAIYRGNVNRLEGGTPIDEAMLYLARFGEVFKPVVFDNSRDSRGGHNRLNARHHLIKTLAKVYGDFATVPNKTGKYDFILEIMENQNIPDMSRMQIKQLLEAD